jgi:hypothetical protein
MLNRYHSIFTARLKGKTLEDFPKLKAYVYCTLLLTTAGTFGGLMAGVLLGASDFVRQADPRKKHDDMLKKYRTDIQEPFFQKSHTRICGRLATDREVFTLNLLYCSFFMGYESSKLGFIIGTSPVRCPIQHIIWPLTLKTYDVLHQLVEKKLEALNAACKTEEKPRRFLQPRR